MKQAPTTNQSKSSGTPAGLKKPQQVDSTKAPSVFQYRDYRNFLSDWFSWKKQNQSSYSGAVFSKRAGLHSHTLLGMVIRGQRSLTAATIRAFERSLELKSQDSLYFEKLVLFNQSKNSEDKQYYFGQLMSLVKGSESALTQLNSYSQYLSHWYVVAIRELVGVSDFRPDPDWIAARLKKKITRKQADEAWKIILDLKLVEKQASGRYKIVHPKIDLDPGSVDFAIQNYHKDFLQRTKEALDNETYEDRLLYSVTMSVSREDLAELKTRMTKFQKDLISQFPVSKADRSEVVAINSQVLVLSQKLAEK